MQRSLSQYIEELKTTTAQKTAIESELSVARSIQMSMLRKDIPNRPDFEIHAMLTPAKAVGGDLYDFFLRDNNLYFCIGDVAGKGVPAALVMTTVCGAFRLLSESESEPNRIVSHMNDMMNRDSSMTIFVTFFAGVLDLGTGHLLPYIVICPLVPCPTRRFRHKRRILPREAHSSSIQTDSTRLRMPDISCLAKNGLLR